MPQSPNQQAKNQFNKGLLTEFSELAFPENASIDELNCDLFKGGNRSRRLGISFEEDFVYSKETYAEDSRFSTVGIWRRVGKDEELQYVVVQAGSSLIFYKKNPGGLSSEPVPVSILDSSTFIVDLNSYSVPSSGVDLTKTPIDIASIDGSLVVVGKGLKPFFIERDNNTGTFTIKEILFRVRDFEYLGDIEEYFDKVPKPISNSRLYDTYNCGWIESVLRQYLNNNTTTSNDGLFVQTQSYPPLNLPWFAAKNSSNNFDPIKFNKEWKGTTLIVNGRFLLDPFAKDRSAASGISGLKTELINKRFSTVASFSSRLFYAGIDSKVYFSQIFEGQNEYGNLYQKNDPTAETFNSLLDTDGGVINIPEAVNIKKLHVFGSSILVFADNGVWRISGVDGVFRATEFSVYKVSGEGLASEGSFVAGRNAVPFWWSFNGIHTLQVTEEGGMTSVDLSADTVQTFWSDISGPSKLNVRSAFDYLNDRVIWLYSNTFEETAGKLNNLLLLDTELGAFFPWKISDKTTNTPYILDAIYLDSSVSSVVEFDVVDNDSNQIITPSDEDVTQSTTGLSLASVDIKFLTYDRSNSKITFSTFSDTSFLDWNEADYISYAEAAYNFLGDLGRRKSNPYVTVFCKATEKAWVKSGVNYVFDRPSSLFVSNYWDFKTEANTEKQQAYRLHRPIVASSSLIYEPNKTVITSRLKMRGRGRVMRLRFESETGKDFDLLGWEVLGGVNPTY